MIELLVWIAVGAAVGLIAVVAAAFASGKRPQRTGRLEDQGWDAERKRWFEG